MPAASGAPVDAFSVALTDDEIDSEAYERERADLVRVLIKHREQRWKGDEDWASLVRETGQVELEQFIIGLGKMEMPAAAVKVRAELASENVEGFSEKHIGASDPARTFMLRSERKRKENRSSTSEVGAVRISGDAAVLKEISDYAEKRFAALEAKYRGSIRRTKAKRKEQYRKLQQAGRDPLYVEWDLPSRFWKSKKAKYTSNICFAMATEISNKTKHVGNRRAEEMDNSR